MRLKPKNHFLIKKKECNLVISDSESSDQTVDNFGDSNDGNIVTIETDDNIKFVTVKDIGLLKRSKNLRKLKKIKSKHLTDTQ